MRKIYKDKFSSLMYFTLAFLWKMINSHEQENEIWRRLASSIWRFMRMDYAWKDFPCHIWMLYGFLVIGLFYTWYNPLLFLITIFEQILKNSIVSTSYRRKLVRNFIISYKDWIISIAPEWNLISLEDTLNIKSIS